MREVKVQLVGNAAEEFENLNKIVGEEQANGILMQRVLGILSYYSARDFFSPRLFFDKIISIHLLSFPRELFFDKIIPIHFLSFPRGFSLTK